MNCNKEEQEFPFLFSIDTDTEKREIIITLPSGQNQLVLPQNWIRYFIHHIENQIRKW